MIIRFVPVADSDRESLFQLRRASLGEYIEKTWGWEDVWQRADFDARFNPKTQSVILCNDQAVGMVEIDRTEDQIRIGEIQILPEFQNRGIGTSVIKGILKEADASCLPVTLQVLRVNVRARKLYSLLGFHITGEFPPYIQMVRPSPSKNSPGSA